MGLGVVYGMGLYSLGVHLGQWGKGNGGGIYIFIVGLACHETEWERTLSRLYVCHLLISSLYRCHVQVENRPRRLQHGQSVKSPRPATAYMCWVSFRELASVHSLTGCLCV